MKHAIITSIIFVPLCGDEPSHVLVCADAFDDDVFLSHESFSFPLDVWRTSFVTVGSDVDVTDYDVLTGHFEIWLRVHISITPAKLVSYEHSNFDLLEGIYNHE